MSHPLDGDDDGSDFPTIYFTCDYPGCSAKSVADFGTARAVLAAEGRSWEVDFIDGVSFCPKHRSGMQELIPADDELLEPAPGTNGTIPIAKPKRRFSWRDLQQFSTAVMFLLLCSSVVAIEFLVLELSSMKLDVAAGHQLAFEDKFRIKPNRCTRGWFELRCDGQLNSNLDYPPSYDHHPVIYECVAAGCRFTGVQR